MPEPIAADVLPLLASRRADLGDSRFDAARAAPAFTAPSSSPHFVEIPAVAVTRAVAVAGRGIRSGLRATSAVLRAAF